MTHDDQPKTRKESKKTPKDKKDGMTGKFSSKHIRRVTNILETKATFIKKN